MSCRVRLYLLYKYDFMEELRHRLLLLYQMHHQEDHDIDRIFIKLIYVDGLLKGQLFATSVRCAFQWIISVVLLLFLRSLLKILHYLHEFLDED